MYAKIKSLTSCTQACSNLVARTVLLQVSRENESCRNLLYTFIFSRFYMDQDSFVLCPPGSGSFLCLVSPEFLTWRQRAKTASPMSNLIFRRREVPGVDLQGDDTTAGSTSTSSGATSAATSGGTASPGASTSSNEVKRTSNGGESGIGCDGERDTKRRRRVRFGDGSGASGEFPSKASTESLLHILTMVCFRRKCIVIASSWCV